MFVICTVYAYIKLATVPLDTLLSFQNFYNLGHNILRLFDVSQIFFFTARETNRYY